jgi:hypothetical protein
MRIPIFAAAWLLGGACAYGAAIPQTTPFTRDLLRSANPSAARSKLGIVGTNGTVSFGDPTAAISDVPIAGTSTNAMRADAAPKINTNMIATVTRLLSELNTLSNTLANANFWSTNEDGAIIPADSDKPVKIPGQVNIGTWTLDGFGPDDLIAFDASSNAVPVTVGSGLSLTGDPKTLSVASTHYTVATLPGSATAGDQLYASDALTPWGTGARVEWDGTIWREPRTRIMATTTMADYILSAASNAVQIFTPLSDIDIATIYGTAGTIYEHGRNKGAGVTFDTQITTSGILGRLTSGTGANSYTIAAGYTLDDAVANDVYACGGRYAFSAECDATETYFAWVGFSASFSGTNLPPANFVGFLYDRWNLMARGGAGSETNHWLCATIASSSGTYTDSGLTPTFSADGSSLSRLAVIWGTTGATFYTNGVLCATQNATTIPAASQYYAETVAIVKHAGTTARYLYEGSPWTHIRRATARTY